MGCHIAENQPLQDLRKNLGLKESCHSSLRAGRCVHALPQQDGLKGVTGAVIGYCQALFANAGTPKTQTVSVITALEEIKAPWRMSHELFWGYRNGHTAEAFVEEGCAPLVESGRVPVVITGLDTHHQWDEIHDLVSSVPKVAEGETILLRLTMHDEHSGAAAAVLIDELASEAKKQERMPLWWPLLQSNSPEAWERLEKHAGGNWHYINAAVNSFTPLEVFKRVSANITVAQIPLGLAEGVASDGAIRLAAGQTITGAVPEAVYNIYEYCRLLAALETAPTLIILGPALPNWTDEMNKARVAALLPHLTKATETLWEVAPNIRAEVLKLAA